jgi:hypothetical protein
VTFWSAPVIWHFLGLAGSCDPFDSYYQSIDFCSPKH